MKAIDVPAPPLAARSPAPVPTAPPARRHPEFAVPAAGEGPRMMLLPSQWYFGPAPRLMRTLLGSCVAITIWHPKRKVGGMCHYLLPSRTREPNMPLEGRFGDEALGLLTREIARAALDPREFVAQMYGGADTLPDHLGVKFNIGERNIEVGWQLIERFGFQLEAIDVGDCVPRTITLDVSTGEVECKRGSPRSN